MLDVTVDLRLFSGAVCHGIHEPDQYQTIAKPSSLNKTMAYKDKSNLLHLS